MSLRFRFGFEMENNGDCAVPLLDFAILSIIRGACTTRPQRSIIARRDRDKKPPPDEKHWATDLNPRGSTGSTLTWIGDNQGLVTAPAATYLLRNDGGSGGLELYLVAVPES